MLFAPEPLHKLGKYRIDALLGQGAMGIVYKAFDTDIDREVAIKILHAHLLEGDMGDELMRRFSHEVKAAARCQHPNIVTVYDYGVFQNQPYMVMEYVKGMDLHHFLKSKQKLTAEQSINLILKVLDALHSAHSKGIVHRDIKPANIMLLEDGQVKVTDFGVARIDNSDLTRLGDVMGTPSYMSPEAQNGDTVTASSDLYATAIVLLELLVTKRLKNKNLDYEILLNELVAQNIALKLAENLAQVLKKALQHNPQQRYADALDFSKALNSCLEHGLDYYQMTNDLATTMLSVKKTIQQDIQEDTPSLYQAADSSQLLQTQLSKIEKNLTHYVGPVAKMLVKKQAKQTTNLNQFVNSLLLHIPTESERQKFINSLDLPVQSVESETSSTSHRVTATNHATQIESFSSEYIENVTADLTQYLGPVARHVIKSALKKASTKEEFCCLLAEKIPNLQERAAFLKNRG